MLLAEQGMVPDEEDEVEVDGWHTPPEQNPPLQGVPFGLGA
jgi:hypothetical protein